MSSLVVNKLNFVIVGLKNGFKLFWNIWLFG